jgi:hypothetical protein
LILSGDKVSGMHGEQQHQLELEEQVLEVLARWDRRLEIATAAWAELTGGEQRRREAELDADGESDEWVVVLWNWWNQARLTEQEQLRRDVTVLAGALWAAAGDGRLDSPSEEAESARHLLRALDRMAEILAVD